MAADFCAFLQQDAGNVAVGAGLASELPQAYGRSEASRPSADDADVEGQLIRRRESAQAAEGGREDAAHG